MKKRFTLTALMLTLASGSLLFSQNVKKIYPEVSAKPTMGEEIQKLNRTSPGSGNLQFAGDTLWKEDFSTAPTGGIPTGWVATGTNPLWRKATKISSTGHCYYSLSGGKLHSTTEANGTLLFDADSANRAAAGGVCGTNTAKLGTVTTGAINLTGNADVILKFQHRFRQCCNTGTTKLTVQVSGDGGANFTTLPDARGTTPLNEYPLNQIYAVNISAVAGNKADVRIRITYDNSGLGVYYWELDDIVIVKAWDHELNLVKGMTDFSYMGGGYYTQIPLTQAPPLVSFRGIVMNEGANIESSVKMNVEIKNGASSVYNQNSPVTASFAKGFKDTIDLLTPSFTPTAKGIYTTTFSVSATATDNFASNNKIVKTFEVNDTVFGRDDGIIGSTTLAPSGYTCCSLDNSALGNMYEMTKAGVATSISFFLAISTNKGASLTAHIYKFSNNGTISAAPLVSSDIYDVLDSAVDAGKWVTLPLIPNGGENLMKDSTYLVAIESLVEGTKKMRLSTDLITEQPDGGATYLKDPTTWLGWTSTLARIRLNFGTAVGMNEVSGKGVSLEQNIPNPFDKRTLINYEIGTAANVSLEIYDIAGKLVSEQVAGNIPAGKHSFVINQNFDAGVYFYTLKVDGNTITKKMTVTK